MVNISLESGPESLRAWPGDICPDHETTAWARTNPVVDRALYLLALPTPVQHHLHYLGGHRLDVAEAEGQVV